MDVQHSDLSPITMSRPQPLDETTLRPLPKAELHGHLDGTLLPRTVQDLAREQGITVPGSDELCRAALTVPASCRSLADYLRCFDLPLALLQEPEALARVAREYVDQLAEDGVVYAEVRYAPALSLRRGLTLDEVIDAVTSGLAEGARTHGIAVGFIACTMRHHSAGQNHAVAEAAVAQMRHGVVALDLAGDEALADQVLPVDAYRTARDAGLRRTVHAGEAAGPASVRQALELLDAERIGHGVRSIEDPALVDELVRRGICLEVCVTSNVQTCTVRDVETHPVRPLFDAGVPVTLNTDSRTVSGVTLSGEMALAAARLGFTARELLAMTVNAVEAGFLPQEQRSRAMHRIRSGWSGVG